MTTPKKPTQDAPAQGRKITCPRCHQAATVKQTTKGSSYVCPRGHVFTISKM